MPVLISLADAETFVFDNFLSNADDQWHVRDASVGRDGHVTTEQAGVLLRDAQGQPGPGVTIRRDIEFSPSGECYQVDFAIELKSIGLADDSSGSRSWVTIYFSFAGVGVDLRLYGDRIVLDSAMAQYQVVRFEAGLQRLSFLVDVPGRRVRVRLNGTPIGLYRTYDLKDPGIHIAALGTEDKPAEIFLASIEVKDAEWDNPPHGQASSIHAREVLPAEWPTYLRDVHNSARSPLTGTSCQLRVAGSLDIGGDSLEDVWAYDVQGDGRLELIVSQQGAIRAINLQGDQVWQAEAHGTILGFYDLDGNGHKEIVLNPLVALDAATGKIEFSTGDPASGGAVSMGPWKIADLDHANNGLEAVFFSGTQGSVYRFIPGQREASLDKHFRIADVAQGFVPSLAVADVDRQAPLEIVWVTYDRAFALSLSDGQPRMLHYWNSGRNYAEMLVENIDHDPYPELIVQSTTLREHLAVLDNDGHNLSLRYDQFYEQNYPDNAKDYDVCVGSVQDFDGDGEVEILQSLYNNTGDQRWHTLLINALSGEVKHDLPDCRAEAVVARGDGQPAWILLAQAVSRDRFQGLHAFSPASGSLVVSTSGSLIKDITNHDLPQNLGRSAACRVPILRALRPAGQQPHVILVLEQNAVFAVSLPTGDRDEITRERFRGVSLHASDRIWLADDFDGDAQIDLVVSSAHDSQVHVVSGKDGTDLASIPIRGVRRLATAARLRPDDEQLSVMVVDWNNRLLVCKDLKTHPTIVWEKEVRPRHGLYHEASSVMACDFDGDGNSEILAGMPNNRLALLDHRGEVIRSWELDNPVYEWAVGNFNGNASYDIAVTTSGSITQYRTMMFDSAVESPPVWEVELGPYMSGPAAFDTNQDGIDDYICRYFYMRHILDGRNGLDLQPIPWRQAYHAVTIVHPWKDDPRPALLFHSGMYTQRLERLDGSCVWEKLVHSSARHGCVGDFDGDGRLESACQTSGQVWDLQKLKPIAGDYPPTVYLWDLATGREIAALQIRGNFQEGLVAVDLDSDGRDELIGGLDDGQLVVMGIEDGSLTVESSLEMGAGAGRPTVVDLELDGKPEILVGTDAGRLFVLECAD